MSEPATSSDCETLNVPTTDVVPSVVRSGVVSVPPTDTSPPLTVSEEVSEALPPILIVASSTVSASNSADWSTARVPPSTVTAEPLAAPSTRSSVPPSSARIEEARLAPPVSRKVSPEVSARLKGLQLTVAAGLIVRFPVENAPSKVTGAFSVRLCELPAPVTVRASSIGTGPLAEA